MLLSVLLFFCSFAWQYYYPPHLSLYITIAPPILIHSLTHTLPLHFTSTITIIMDSSKSSALLFICMLFISSATPILGCGYCGTPVPPKHTPTKPTTPTKPPGILPHVPLPPISVPPILPVPLPPVPTVPLPSVPLPSVPIPSVPLPSVPLPSVPIPSVPLPSVPLPSVPIPSVPLPSVPLPPVLSPPYTPSPTPSGKPCPPGSSPSPSPKKTCPIDALKLGSCVDLLGGIVHIGLGAPIKSKCCPILKGLVEADAALCLCTTLKLKLLNLNLYVPLALQLLLTCGKTPPPGFTCSL